MKTRPTCAASVTPADSRKDPAVTSPHPIWNPEPQELARQRRRLRAHRRKLLLKLASRLPSAPFRVLPDFLIIGAAKGATTTLYAYLEESPHVAWSLRKEAFFFNQTFHWGLNWYRAFFPLRSAVARQARAVAGTPKRCMRGWAQ